MKKFPIIIFFIFLCVALIFLWQYQELNITDRIDSETIIWQGKFRELANCLEDYHGAESNGPINPGFIHRDIFPEDFGILNNFGSIKRSYLNSESDFRNMQKEIEIIVKNLSYFDDKDLSYGSDNARFTLIAYKEINLRHNRKRRIQLCFDGWVTLNQNW